MVTTRDELISRIHAMIGDDPSDDAVQLLEDATDTLAAFEEKTKDATDWEEKYADLKRRYVERFSGSATPDREVIEDPADDDEYVAPRTHEELFEVKED